MEKRAFELKANYNSFETVGADDSLVRLEAGDTYVTADPGEANVLAAADAVKEVAVPAGARAGSKQREEKG